jgi:tRNA threonylcarbamoyladenosine biosynthesis protein TsaE
LCLVAGSAGNQTQIMAILSDQTLDFTSSSVEQSVRLGVRLGELLEPGDLLCLSGELGSGKTVLARGIGRGWGAAARVTSPTFTLVNAYPRLRDGRILYHVDAYRLENRAEAITTGLEEILQGDGAVMIEWPERVASFLPPNRLWLEMAYLNETRRSLRFSATGERPVELLKAFRHSAFGVR